MSSRKILFKNSFLLLLFFIIPVAPWTIDLPEIRKHLFEKNENLKKDKSNLETEGRYFYSNKEGNSMHNTKHYEDVYESSPYAQEYGYQTYMEKKVNDIVYRGVQYLDGLQRSLEEYSRLLESCQRMNRTRSGSNSTFTWRPAQETNFTSINSTLSSCENATRASEHVRRLSQLALHTTRELQDIAYQKEYDKGDIKELSMEENELILKLSWFLDRLAHYTGYEPDTSRHIETKKFPSTTLVPPTVPSIMNAPDEVKLQMMKCLEEKSDVPATVRCAYPLPMPDLAREIQNYSDQMTSRMSPNPSSSNINEQVEVMPMRNQEPELLLASETFAPNLKPVKITKRKKRSENAAVNFLNHFTKTKAWMADNSDLKTNNEEFEVINDLPKHVVNKRDVGKVFKKYQHFKLPEDPFQDLSKYIKHKPGVNYIKDETQAAKIKAYIDKINSKIINKSIVQKLNKMFLISKSIHEKDGMPFKKSFVQKRSVKFEKDVDMPRISEDPQQDISYYVKNKEGTNVENNLLQAVQIRAGLEQVFQTGNIEMVRRFGANYNPLVPAPFYAAVLKSMADNI